MAGKWANPFWQVWDLRCLAGMLHGTNGLRTIINDYAEKDRPGFWLKSLLLTVVDLIVVLGTLVDLHLRPLPRAQRARRK